MCGRSHFSTKYSYIEIRCFGSLHYFFTIHFWYTNSLVVNIQNFDTFPYLRLQMYIYFHLTEFKYSVRKLWIPSLILWTRPFHSRYSRRYRYFLKVSSIVDTLEADTRYSSYVKKPLNRLKWSVPDHKIEARKPILLLLPGRDCNNSSLLFLF